MPLGMEVTAADPVEGIDLLDDDQDLEAVVSEKLTLPAGALLATVEWDGRHLDPSLRDQTLYVFPGLRIAVLQDSEQLAALGDRVRIGRSAALHPSFSWTYPLVRALDAIAFVFILNERNPALPLEFRGRAADESRQYPFWDGSSEFLEGRDRPGWATEPMLLAALNMSLGPRSVIHPVDAGDPVQEATRFLSRWTVITAAAGNAGAIKGVETMSAWAQPEWVVAVGATEDEAGKKLWPRSSRGLSDVAESGPDVLAYGRSSVASRPYGTSFAAPRVAYGALFATAILLYLRNLAQRAAGGPVQGIRLAAWCICDRFKEGDPSVRPPRQPVNVLPELGSLESSPASEAFTRMVAAGWDGDLNLTEGPRLVKELLLTSATEVRGLANHEQGAGFFSPEGLRELIATLTAEQWLFLLGLTEHAGELGDLRTRPLLEPEDLDEIATLVASCEQTLSVDWPTGKYTVRPDVTPTKGGAK